MINSNKDYIFIDGIQTFYIPAKSMEVSDYHELRLICRRKMILTLKGIEKKEVGFSITRNEIVDYPSGLLKDFVVERYEFIDNLNFCIDPARCLTDEDRYLRIAEEKFKDAGWNGEGEIMIMWVPPFVLRNSDEEESNNGIVVWHVKQKEDGISWILTPKKFIDY